MTSRTPTAQRWRRLHLIIGDANLFEVATYLKLGTTSLVLFVIEQLDALSAVEGPSGASLRAELAALRLHDPVSDVQKVSRDLDLTAPLLLADGRHLTALEVQRTYADVARRAAEHLGPLDDQTRAVLDRWDSVLARLGTDPASCAREVEWVAKLRLLDRLRRRDHLDWDHPRLAAMDLQWSDVRPERGIYHRLLAAGAAERLVDERAVSQAVHHAPEDTRAYFRGEVMARFGDEVSAASWDSVIFDVAGAPSLQRVPMLDPLRGTRRAHRRAARGEQGRRSAAHSACPGRRDDSHARRAPARTRPESLGFEKTRSPSRRVRPARQHGTSAGSTHPGGEDGRRNAPAHRTRTAVPTTTRRPRPSPRRRRAGTRRSTRSWRRSTRSSSPTPSPFVRGFVQKGGAVAERGRS